MKRDQVSDSLITTITDRGAADLLGDATEAALDDFLADGVLKNVPIVGSLMKIAKVGVGISDYLFLKKVARFLHELNDVTDEERHEFLGRLQVDDEHRREVGETLMLLLDRIDDMNKATLLARGFKAYLQGRIDQDTFRRIGFAIDTLYLGFIQQLACLREPDLVNLRAHVSWNFATCGILEPSGQPPNRSGIQLLPYKFTEFGETFQSVVLEC